MSATIDFRLVKQLWMFLAVAEEEHFGRAAQKLGMSQPPLTKQIQVLEQSLGLALFERSRRGTRLSPAGQAILPSIRRFADQVSKLEAEVREVASGQTGILRVGAITSAMLETIPDLLDEVSKKYPNVKIFIQEIDTVEAIPALQAGELDLAFGRLEGDIEGDISWKALEEARLAVALPASSELARKKVLSLKHLENEPMVIFAREVSPVYFDMLVSWCRASGFSPRFQYEVRSVASQVAYVSCGQGVALVPATVERLAPENVAVRPLKENIPVVTAAIAWNAKSYNPMVTAILDLVPTRKKK